MNYNIKVVKGRVFLVLYCVCPVERVVFHCQKQWKLPTALGSAGNFVCWRLCRARLSPKKSLLCSLWLECESEHQICSLCTRISDYLSEDRYAERVGNLDVLRCL